MKTQTRGQKPEARGQLNTARIDAHLMHGARRLRAVEHDLEESQRWPVGSLQRSVRYLVVRSVFKKAQGNLRAAARLLGVRLQEKARA